MLKPLLKYTRALIRFTLIIINNLYCIPTHVLWLTILLPMRKYAPAVYYKIEGLMFSWLLSMVALWSWSAGYNIVEQGDDITRCLNKKTLIIVNHQSTADVPLLMSAFNAKPCVLPHIMWIMDKAFKYTNFGIVSMFHLDFFIASGKSNREQSIQLFESHLHTAYVERDRQWMVLFPEGGFLRKRREVSQRFAKKNNFPLLENVTLPRLGALFTVRDVLLTDNNDTSQHRSAETQRYTNGELRNGSSSNQHQTTSSGKSSSTPQLEYILDITIAYPQRKPLDLLNIIHGLREPCDTHFYYRLYSTKDIPKDDEKLSSWIYQRFIEKETLLDNFYKSNSFVLNNNNSSTVNGGTRMHRPAEDGDNTMSKSSSSYYSLALSNGGSSNGNNSNSEMGPFVVQQDLLRFVILHLFFITSTYVHMRIFCTILDYYYQFYAFSF